MIRQTFALPFTKSFSQLYHHCTYLHHAIPTYRSTHPTNRERNATPDIGVVGYEPSPQLLRRSDNVPGLVTSVWSVLSQLDHCGVTMLGGLARL